MDFLEKDLEQIIYDASQEQLDKFNFPRGIKKRQLRIGNYGIADLVYFERISVGRICFDDNRKPYEETESVGLKITVCELKKDKIGISAFLQAVGYCKGIYEYLQSRGFDNFYFDILLVGKDVDKSGSFIFLADLLNQSIKESYEGLDSSEICDPYGYFNRAINNVDFKTYSYDFDGIKFEDHNNYKLTNPGF